MWHYVKRTAGIGNGKSERHTPNARLTDRSEGRNSYSDRQMFAYNEKILLINAFNIPICSGPN